VLVVPVVASAAAAVLRGLAWGAVAFILLGGIVIAMLLFASISSGQTSSNWGTFRREREPARYWMDVAILVCAYAFFAVFGYFCTVK
jgi:hypothetical protein